MFVEMIVPTEKTDKRVYFVFLVFFSVSSVLLISYPKDELHYLLTSWSHPTLDIFFSYVTYLGHGIFFAIIIVVYLLTSRVKSLIFITGAFITLVVSQTLKHIVFDGYPRPIEALGAENIRLIEGLDIAHWYSFPSGHAITVITMVILLIWYCKHKGLQLLYAHIGVIVCFSRVYLSQHFLIDVVAGAVLGIFIALSSWILTHRLVQIWRK